MYPTCVYSKLCEFILLLQGEALNATWYSAPCYIIGKLSHPALSPFPALYLRPAKSLVSNLTGGRKNDGYNDDTDEDNNWKNEMSRLSLSSLITKMTLETIRTMITMITLKGRQNYYLDSETLLRNILCPQKPTHRDPF